MVREKNKTVEILSPAKNLDYGKEVIKCGADAVYIGAPKHSMRKQHTNSMEDIKELIEYAHKYWVKVYIAVNCLLFTEEDIDSAKKMIEEFYKMEADAVIIQDIGILELDLPPIPIILSTNVMCYDKEFAQFFEKIGVSKIVLPRDLSFEKIEDITKNSNVKIEAFCYGFNCPVICGNCYLAYVENLLETNSYEKARYMSSNNGTCPERCLRNWTLRDADGNIIRENDRLMNVRYLNFNNDIEKLFSVGVSSFKIAGREKDLKHAKNSTAIFSRTADEMVKKLGIKRSSSGRTILNFEPDLHKNFNKGFSNFFLYGRKKEMYSKYTLVGEDVGTVTDFSNNSFKLKSDTKLAIGDKLRYKINDEKVKTIEVVGTENGKYQISPINDDLTGLNLFRYINVEGFKEVEDSVNYRVISVTVNIFDNGEKYNINAVDEDNNKIEMIYPKGKNSVQNLQKELYNLDVDCEFVVDSVNSESSVYIDDIEDLRNKIFVQMRAERAKNRPKENKSVIKNNIPYYKKELTYLDNVSNEYTKNFFKRHGVEKIENGMETSSDIKGKKVQTNKYCLRYELGLCTKSNPENIPPLPWTIEQLECGIKYKIEFDCKKCLMYLYISD